jgi:tetratricopeptide (TPR) repeat protein
MAKLHEKKRFDSRSQAKGKIYLMFLWKLVVKIGIISFFLPLNPAFGTANARFHYIWGQKHPSFTKTFIAATEEQKRTALIIGNSDYQKTGRLPNPVNDATDMAKALQELGFDVILLEDATLRQMGEALNEFHAKLSQGGVGVFYYAGHGMQLDSENYLIPIDAQLERKQDTPYEALPVGKILGAMEDANNDVNIIILDACRDNAFSRQWQRSSQAEGLAPVQAVRGTYIAYATAPGDVAADGEDRNGTFTAQILRHIKTPNLSVEEMFKRVRQDVLRETNNQQIPWDSSSLVGDFSFNQTSSPVSDPPSTPVATSTPTQEAATSTPTPTQEATKPTPNFTPEATKPTPTPPQEDTTPASNPTPEATKPTPTPSQEATKPTPTPSQEAAISKPEAAQEVIEQEDERGTINDFTQEIALNPKNAEAYNDRAEAYRNSRQYRNAIADLDRAISLNPNFGEAYYNRANAYLNLQKYQEAIADLNQVISFNPDYANGYNNRGVAYLNLQKYQEAIADFDKAIQLDPDFSEAYNSRGTSHYYLKKYQEAIADFDKAIALNPTAESYYNRGNAYRNLKQYPKVFDDYNKALELDPNYAEIYYNRGAIYTELNRYQEAIADLERATQLFCQQKNPNCQKAQATLQQLQTGGN